VPEQQLRPARTSHLYKDLTIAHVNIRSLRHKTHHIHQLLLDHKIDILSINETHLDGTINDYNISIPGYDVFRKDRNLFGGGVCLYALSGLRIKRHTPQIHPELEALHVRLFLSTNGTFDQLVVSTVYRPPNSGIEFWEAFSEQLDEVAGKASIVVGDFNCDVLRPSHHNRHLVELCSAQLLNNLVTVPTRVPSGTCLDLALVQTGVPAGPARIVPMDDISDHHLVILPVLLSNWEPPSRSTHRFVRKPRLHNINYDQFNVDLLAASSRIPPTESFDGYTDAVLQVVNDTTNHHAPGHYVRLPKCPKPKPSPWMTPHLRQLLQLRTALKPETQSTASGNEIH